MALANCSQCGRLFNKIAYDLCPDCVNKVEQDFEKVYQFLRESGASHIDVIHQETGVDKRQIMKFLAEDRFEGVTVSYKCESCGEAITSGKLCAKCVESINKQIEKMQQEAAPKNQPGQQQTSLDRYHRKK